MQKFSFSPPWLRNMFLILLGGMCFSGSAGLTIFLVHEGFPSLLASLQILALFVFPTCAFVFSLMRKGPLRQLLWVYGGLCLYSAVKGALPILSSSEPESMAAWVNPIIAIATALLVFWVASTRIKEVTESGAS